MAAPIVRWGHSNSESKMRIYFSKGNRASISPVCDDYDFHKLVGYWLSGKVFGRYFNLFVPWKGRVK
jgi:hypothetical protein